MLGSKAWCGGVGGEGGNKRNPLTDGINNTFLLFYSLDHQTKNEFCYIKLKKICFVQERGSLPSPSFICMIYVPIISEQELEQFFFSDGQ